MRPSLLEIYFLFPLYHLFKCSKQHAVVPLQKCFCCLLLTAYCLLITFCRSVNKALIFSSTFSKGTFSCSPLSISLTVILCDANSSSPRIRTIFAPSLSALLI